MIITSRSNPSIKAIRSLRDRKHREHSRLYFVEGIRIVSEAIQLGAQIEEIVVAPTLLSSEYGRDIVASWQHAGGQYLEVTEEVFQSISARDNPQGLAAVVKQRLVTLDEISPERNPLWVALSNVQDPGNLGSILRTGDAVGCSGAILVGHTTDPFDPEAVRASMGAIFSQRLVRASIRDLAFWKTEYDYKLVGTSDAATTDYQEVAYATHTIVLMGSEQHGLSLEEQSYCDVIVRIPMAGRSDSLNLAVATGVVLYEIFNQHRRLAGPDKQK